VCEAEAGRVEDGLATLDAQRAAIEQTGERWFDAEVHRVRGELLLKLRRPDVAAATSLNVRASCQPASAMTSTPTTEWPWGESVQNRTPMKLLEMRRYRSEGL
jgi:hypothetical protein